ncbi:hypothetical protein AB0N07_49750, partial [Streptomyces sp. NPDC051172]
PDDRETVMSGSAGGRAEQDLSQQAPHRAADPTAWLVNCRRLVRDYERSSAAHEAYVKWAMVTLMTRRLAAAGPTPAPQASASA